VDGVNPYDSHEDIEKPRVDQENNGAYNTRTTNVREGAIGGS